MRPDQLLHPKLADNNFEDIHDDEDMMEMRETRFADQNQRLLFKTDDDDSSREHGFHSKDQARTTRRRTVFAGQRRRTLAGLVVLLLLGFLAHSRLRENGETPVVPSTVTGGSQTDFRRPSSDYVLDPNWDFAAPPQTRTYNWVLENIEANPDGVFRQVIAINGKFPGELIRLNEGDTVVVNIDNRMENATSIHWHGIFQNGTNYYDGAPGVTQCPIAPGKKFQYKFTVQGQSGTYLYHGHQGADNHDGLYGPIVVHGRNETASQPIPYASDRVVMLSDWYYDVSGSLLMQKLSPGSERSPIPNGALINGVNKVDCSLHSSRRCDSSSISLPRFDLEKGAHHRFRLLNAGAFAWFEVSLDRHADIPVTEVDGTPVEPAPVDSLLISPGQRYSMVVLANVSSANMFWFRGRMVKHCFADSVLPENGVDEVQAVVRYYSELGMADKEPYTENDSGNYATKCKDPAVGKFRPRPALAAPAHAHHSYHLTVNVEIGDGRLERGFINGSTFWPNLAYPSLHRVLDGLASKNQSFMDHGVNTHAFDTKHELVVGNREPEVVDVILQNLDKGNHPFHLHGTTFWLLGSGNGTFPGYEKLGLAAEGVGLLDPKNDTVIKNPLRRDVAALEGLGWLLIRFVADNPGLWLLHCHMTWHAESGMAMQFLSRMDLLENMTLPDANIELCKAGTNELHKGAAPPDSTFKQF